jgi:hypothetical protein
VVSPMVPSLNPRDPTISRVHKILNIILFFYYEKSGFVGDITTWVRIHAR